MAIAFDASSQGNAIAPTTTVSHTCSGANRILWSAVFTTGNDTITGVTYNGVSMTQAVKRSTASVQYVYLYYLIAPATGTHNVVASDSGSNNVTVTNMSFTGAKQTGVPDATGFNTGSATVAPVSVTTVANNCFAVISGRFNTGTVSAGANTTLVGLTNLPGVGGYSTTPQTPPGVFTLEIDSTVSTTFGIVGASFAPAPLVVNSGNFFLFK